MYAVDLITSVSARVVSHPVRLPSGERGSSAARVRRLLLVEPGRLSLGWLKG